MVDFNSIFEDKKFDIDKKSDNEAISYVDDDGKGKLSTSYTNFTYDDSNDY